jgi:shikimate kinase
LKSIHQQPQSVNLPGSGKPIFPEPLSPRPGVDYRFPMGMELTASRIFIAGPPCSGKSEAGRCLAAMLGVAFIDLDRVIEREASMAIPEVFRQRGEAGFRDLESRALEESIREHGASVTALGGGCLLSERNLRLVMESGELIALTASMEALLERMHRQEGERPLAMTDADLTELMRARLGHYLSLDRPIDTTGFTPEQTASAILERLRELPS